MKSVERLTWALHELMNSKPENIKTGLLEVSFNDELGFKGSENIDIFEMARESKYEILSLTSALEKTERQFEEKQLEVSELKSLLKSVVENRKDDDWMFEMASQIEDAIS